MTAPDVPKLMLWEMIWVALSLLLFKNRLSPVTDIDPPPPVVRLPVGQRVPPSDDPVNASPNFSAAMVMVALSVAEPPTLPAASRK